MISGARVYPTIPVTDIGKARGFYGGTLGFLPMMEVGDAATMYATSGGPTFLVYVSNGPTNGQHTAMGFLVDDIEAEVADLRGRGVVFDEYDMEIAGVGHLTTENSIASTGPVRTAWFRDPEGNVLAVTQIAG